MVDTAAVADMAADAVAATASAAVMLRLDMMKVNIDE